jgi:glycosyltransferase involved in cell wall biosynthesis
MKISIVIPVYNEAAQLGACLEAIAAQAVTPYEVIVVDNNSTDNTAGIAANYSFVTLLREERQGVVHARNRGFDAAAGDIIGRIDADTLLPPDWAAQIQSIFQDSSVSAVSGAPHYYDFALSGVADSIDLYLRARLARRLKNTNFLWGANMAVRQVDWRRVRSLLCEYRNLHEDFDLAIHLQQLGLQVIYDESLLAGVSSRRIDTGFIAYVRYTMASPRTYAAHQLRSRFHMYPVLMVCWVGYVPGRLVYRGCNPETGAFSLSQLLLPNPSRVDPTINVA